MYVVTLLHSWYSILLIVSGPWELREVGAVLAEYNDEADLDGSEELERELILNLRMHFRDKSKRDLVTLQKPQLTETRLAGIPTRK